MKLRNGLFLATLAGGGYAAYKVYSKKKALEEKYDQVIAFNGKRDIIDGTFNGASYAVLFAGLEIDLTEATMVGSEAVLDIYGEFCGVEIKVPKHWNVTVVGEHEKSGFANQVEYNEEDTTSPKLTIKYNVKYAGVEITESKKEKGCIEDVDIIDIPGEAVPEA